ncbi:MAG: prepilin-type N-terminal cleavage/methylation domain-containing protein, partial [Xanthomonadales bacterium]|nr:prepilin-type N-terminal cleavage/methylation domain-containing protein [Xanthomonadales bacterium]
MEDSTHRELADPRDVSPRSSLPIPHSPFSIPRSSRGFTMIELIVVIVLIGIVASVVAFSFAKSLSGARIQAASRDLVAALRYTRGQAIVKGEQKVLVLDLEKNTYQAPGRNEIELPKDMALRLTTAQKELTGEKAGGIRFFPDGSSTGGNIAVVLGEREWKINVGWLT